MMEKCKFWGPIPVYVLQDHRHRGAHLRVLGAILSCPAPHFPSLKEIAERSGHTSKYCSNVISDLVSFGTIEREQRYRNTNVYRLTGAQVTSTTVVVSDSTPIMEQKESLKENIKPNGGLRGFGYFKHLYPRHRLGSAKKLQEFWIENDLESQATLITDSVKSHAHSDEWLKNNGMYVPKAMKFLDEERWVAVESFNPFAQFKED